LNQLDGSITLSLNPCPVAPPVDYIRCIKQLRMYNHHTEMAGDIPIINHPTRLLLLLCTTDGINIHTSCYYLAGWKNIYNTFRNVESASRQYLWYRCWLHPVIHSKIPAGSGSLVCFKRFPVDNKMGRLLLLLLPHE
jgi:hypothetical protein